MIRVVVTGACGRMGREVLKAVWGANDMQLAGAVDVRSEGLDAGEIIGVGKTGIIVKQKLEEVLAALKPDVAVDFTGPDSVYHNTMTCLKYKVRPVVGTTGMDTGQIKEIIDTSAREQVGGLIAPNFAIGALLMMKFAAEAARYLPGVEIIELHHDKKLDAPSGTAIKTAEMIAEQRTAGEGVKGSVEKINGVRGGDFGWGIRIHSVRLPGLVAHQEVIFGGTGETLLIRHDSLSRESFMPGVLFGIRKVMELKKVVYGLDKLLFE